MYCRLPAVSPDGCLVMSRLLPIHPPAPVVMYTTNCRALGVHVCAPSQHVTHFVGGSVWFVRYKLGILDDFSKIQICVCWSGEIQPILCILHKALSSLEYIL